MWFRLTAAIASAVRGVMPSQVEKHLPGFQCPEPLYGWRKVTVVSGFTA